MDTNFLPRSSRVPALLLALTFLVGPLEGADGWPQFRGPDGQGHATATGVPLHWSERENIRWKTALPGRGWSSPVFDGGNIWLTAALEKTAAEKERSARVEGRPMAQDLEVALSITLLALELDPGSGRLMRKLKLFHVDSPQPIHALNSYAVANF